ncbi:8050_t:CDS:2 [Ambispora leptoticha]|uniref:8050_t:CDS:1 n=1 Tax=Ambispora leptoticha TaxID=144679 RepID=A0A9N8YRC8_9GLOM|nr:8050_t:CDS:2 [Ambispora leptoticha]
MALPKLLSPRFWFDKCLTLFLQLILALLLQTLYLLKGEDVRVTDVKVTVRKSLPSKGSRSIANSPLKSTKQTTVKQNGLTVKAGPTTNDNDTTATTISSAIIEATSNPQGDLKCTKEVEEKIIGTLTEVKPANLQTEILLEENNVATPITPIENEVVAKGNESESSETISSEKIILEEESATPIVEESASMEESKEESKEEAKEEFEEESKEESAALEDDSVQSSNVSEASLSPMSSPTLSPTEDTEKVAQLAPLEMKTSHEFTLSSDATTAIVEFHWKHGGTNVFVTGDFDKWQVTHQMQKDPVTGHFTTKIPIDITKQQAFKFVVDGNWCVNNDWPSTRDEHNNENNVIYAFGSGPMSPEYKEYVVSPYTYAAAAY